VTSIWSFILQITSFSYRSKDV